VAGDAHAGPWHRQVSLLAMESVEKMRAAGATVEPGAFGENVTTHGLVLYDLPVGTRMQLGECLVEVTQIGKECHDRCAIYHQVGDCVMPREGIFVRVLRGGGLRAGDAIRVLPAAEQPRVRGAEKTLAPDAGEPPARGAKEPPALSADAPGQAAAGPHARAAAGPEQP
jgi:MOSC domain-containing protein YiiM